MDDAVTQPACKYGADCYRKNPDHRLKFSHPAKVSPPELALNKEKQDFVAPLKPNSLQAVPGKNGTLEVESTEDRASSSSFGKSLVVVLLVGVPGSGKSAFCHAVIENASQTWTRICQDVIANGKRGTKAQCLKQADSALKSSSSVFIDRCNLNKEQRAEFLEFAKNANVEAHAVVLNLPIGLCITRAMQRTSHEGDLQGKKVGAVIQRMAQSVELPRLDEGFTRITVCRTDADVQNAIESYRQLSASSKLPPGIFDSSPKSTTKGSLQQYLQPPQKRGATGGSTGHNGGSEMRSDAEPVQTLTESNVIPDMILKDGSGSKAEASEEGWKTLAFPSISTADFRFDHEKAANIIVETAMDFLSRRENDGLRLAMIDIEADSDMLSRVRKKAASLGLDERRFLCISGDITRLRSTGGPSCSIIANAANWRLKGGGGGVNLAIYRAAGEGFEEATKQCAKTLSPGAVVGVPLPSSSPLRVREGVTHVIHVLGPNMNPQRPNCIQGDYFEGCRLLRAAYSSLFSTFSSLAKGQAMSTGEGTPVASRTPPETYRSDGSSPRDAFAVLMQSSKRKNGNDDAASLKRGRTGASLEFKNMGDFAEMKDEGNTEEQISSIAGAPGSERNSGPSAQHSAEVRASTSRTIKWPAWAQALHDTAFHPEKHQKVLLEVTDEAVVLPDLYAKARKHVLVVSRVNGLDSIADLRKEHLSLLRQMHAIGERWATKFLNEDPSLVFRLGYHWVPSMRQLHLHVVSQDFDSTSLKNKKHWNSFTTSYFKDSKDVIAEIEKTGSLQQCSEDMEKTLLDSELRCHRCRCVQPNIPRLRAHISSCKKPFPFQNALITAGQ